MWVVCRVGVVCILRTALFHCIPLYYSVYGIQVWRLWGVSFFMRGTHNEQNSQCRVVTVTGSKSRKEVWAPRDESKNPWHEHVIPANQILGSFSKIPFLGKRCVLGVLGVFGDESESDSLVLCRAIAQKNFLSIEIAPQIPCSIYINKLYL